MNMLGFGASAQDKLILRDIEMMLDAFSYLGIDNRAVARRVFYEAKDELKRRGGPNVVYDERFGDRAVANDEFMKPRLADGLRREDVRRYWNRSQILIFCELKVREFVAFVAFDAARILGKDLAALARENRKTIPQYGNPGSWDEKHPANEGYTREDAEIFNEFSMRVGLWQTTTPLIEQTKLLSPYTSFNALVRDFVRKGMI
jgi:hypothetical protein